MITPSGRLMARYFFAWRRVDCVGFAIVIVMVSLADEDINGFWLVQSIGVEFDVGVSRDIIDTVIKLC